MSDYTPRQFADFLGRRADDYVQLTSYTHHPFYREINLELPDNWAEPVLLRAGTVIIHGLATGLMGLGWYELMVHRRRLAFLGYSVAAVILHGAWNGLSGILALGSLEFASDGMENIAGLGAAVIGGATPRGRVSPGLCYAGTGTTNAPVSDLRPSQLKPCGDWSVV